MLILLSPADVVCDIGLIVVEVVVISVVVISVAVLFVVVLFVVDLQCCYYCC